MDQAIQASKHKHRDDSSSRPHDNLQSSQISYILQLLLEMRHSDGWYIVRNLGLETWETIFHRFSANGLRHIFLLIIGAKMIPLTFELEPCETFMKCRFPNGTLNILYSFKLITVHIFSQNT